MENGFTARLRPGDERAEARDPYEAQYGATMEYYLNFKIPKDARLETENQSMVVAQLKASNDQSPPLALRWKGNGEFTITIRHDGGEVIAYRGPLQQGSWHGFEINVTTGEGGRVVVERNGQLLVSYQGPVGYRETFTYFKFGPYDFTKTQKSDLAIQYGFFSRASTAYPRDSIASAAARSRENEFPACPSAQSN